MIDRPNVSEAILAIALQKRADRLLQMGVTPGSNEPTPYSKAAADLSRLLQLPNLSPTQTAAALVARAKALRADRKNDEALAADSRIIEMTGLPEDEVGKALARQAFWLADQEKFDAAIANLERALALNAISTQTRRDAAGDLIRTKLNKQHAADVERLTKAIDAGAGTLPPEQLADALLDRAAAHARAKYIAKADEDYTKVIELAGVGEARITAALLGRGEVRNVMPRGTDGAMKDLQAVIDSQNTTPAQIASAVIARSRLNRTRGRLDEIQKSFTRVLETKDMPAVKLGATLRERGALHRAGQNKEAAGDYNRLLLLDGASPATWRRRWWRSASRVLRKRVLKKRWPTSPPPSTCRACRVTCSRRRSSAGRAFMATKTNQEDIADFDRVLALPDATPAQRGTATHYRSTSAFARIVSRKRSTDIPA